MDKYERPIRILHVVGGIMRRGGIESYLMNYYKNIDRSMVQFDFVVHGFGKGVYDEEILELGGIIYHVPVKTKDLQGNLSYLRRIFSGGRYNIVHSNMDAANAIVLNVAKHCGVPVRISHSHNTQHLTRNPVKVLADQLMRFSVGNYATHLFACSESAGRWLYGEKAVESGEVHIVKNAIKIADYRYSECSRKKVRNELGIEGYRVVGHVGRFDTQKNHAFLIKAFESAYRKDNKLRLLLVGEGRLRGAIESEIVALGLHGAVICAGNRSDVPGLLSAMDVFVFPSIFEGLGMSLVEAQASGLKCIASDRVPPEADIRGVLHLPLSSKDTWGEKILELSHEEYERHIDENDFVEAGYDITKESCKLEEFYLALYQGIMK